MRKAEQVAWLGSWEWDVQDDVFGMAPDRIKTIAICNST